MRPLDIAAHLERLPVTGIRLSHTQCLRALKNAAQLIREQNSMLKKERGRKGAIFCGSPRSIGNAIVECMDGPIELYRFKTGAARPMRPGSPPPVGGELVGVFDLGCTAADIARELA